MDNFNNIVAAYTAMLPRYSLYRNVQKMRYKYKGLFEITLGMTMQEFIDKGYAEPGKAYDSYGQEVPN